LPPCYLQPARQNSWQEIRFVYSPLRGKSYDRVVILGIGHAMTDGLLCLTEKDFETPLGRVACDVPAVRTLAASAGPFLTENDFAHKNEHSIEFQLIFLQHLLPAGFRIVPVLCGGFSSLDADGGRPRELLRFYDALRELASDASARTLWVAGADLSHVGPKFGDDRTAAAILPESEAHDRRLLDALCRRDIEGLWAETRSVEDRYHVCGFSALTCLMEILPEGTQGRLLHYENWDETATQSAVSFASVSFNCLETATADSRQLKAGGAARRGKTK